VSGAGGWESRHEGRKVPRAIPHLKRLAAFKDAERKVLADVDHLLAKVRKD
jgi:hypothetical protein